MKALTPAYRIAHLILIIAMAVLALLAPAKADAAQCAPFDEVLAGLATRWDEAPVAGGLVDQGAILVLFSDSEGDTWTLVLRQANGTACLVASGTGWQADPPAPQGREG